MDGHDDKRKPTAEHRSGLLSRSFRSLHGATAPRGPPPDPDSTSPVQRPSRAEGPALGVSPVGPGQGANSAGPGDTPTPTASTERVDTSADCGRIGITGAMPTVGELAVSGVGSMGSVGGAEAGLDETETGGDVSGQEAQRRVRAAVERLKVKIRRTNEAIQHEQSANEDNVREYLAAAAASADPPAPPGPSTLAAAARIKAAFEKKNQRSAQNVAQLQRKLDEYNRRLAEVTRSRGGASGAATNPGAAWGAVGGHRPAKSVLKDVGQGLKDFFVRDSGRSRESSPCGSRDASANARDPANANSGLRAKDVAAAIRNQCGSSDSITAPPKSVNPQTTTQLSSDDKSTNGHLQGSVMRDASDEDLSRSSALSDSASVEFHVSPRRRTLPRDHRGAPGGPDAPTGAPVCPAGGGVDLTSVQAELMENLIAQRRLQATFDGLKNKLEREGAYYAQVLEEERDRCERLEEQINDLGELHQHEVTNIKQELASMQEKIEYQLDERTRDMQELLDSCQTKISKMEMQQQHQQQLISMEGIENSNFRAILTKLINVLLAILAVILVLVSTVANLLGPFLTNRLRIVSTVCFIACMVAAWDNWPVISDALERLVVQPCRRLLNT